MRPDSLRDRTKRVGDIGEFGLIEYLRKSICNAKDVVVGIGDDCAVLRSKTKGLYDLITTDTLVENVHFTSKDLPSKIGRKAMGVNISDIAAMGGIPHAAVISIAAPRECEIARIKGIYRGMTAIGKKFSVDIVGGDTVLSTSGLIITITLTGSVRSDRVALRSGARPGDSIFVTGTLGGSILGKHLAFTPRLNEARFLVEKFKVTSMIDISDGLSSDLHRITAESRVGAVINKEDIPVSSAAKKYSAINGRDLLETALNDGEDFELLFTLPPEEVKKLRKEWAQKFKLRLTRIGEITKIKTLRLVDKQGGEKEIPETGYDHFA